MTENQRLHVWIEGRVQGVGFRFFVRETAARFPTITGWVRNLHNGNVELVAEGNRKNLEDFLVVVKEGPNGSRVTNARVVWEKGTGEFDRFGIQATA